MAKRPEAPTITLAEINTFADMIKPRRREDSSPVEHDRYIAMLQRIIRAATSRAIDDITTLPMLVVAAQDLADSINIAVATNAARFAADPLSGASQGECAKALGITVQSCGDRKILGQIEILKRLRAAEDQAGVTRVRFAERGQTVPAGRTLADERTEAERERTNRQTAVAKVLDQIAEYRQRRQPGRHRAA
jgi:hypothetical protein